MVCYCSLAGTAACNSCLNKKIYFNDPYTYIDIKIPLNQDIKSASKKIKPIIQYWCNNCDSILTPHQKYCHNCGKEIDWSEIFTNEE